MRGGNRGNQALVEAPLEGRATTQGGLQGVLRNPRLPGQFPLRYPGREQLWKIVVRSGKLCDFLGKSGTPQNPRFPSPRKVPRMHLLGLGFLRPASGTGFRGVLPGI